MMSQAAIVSLSSKQARSAAKSKRIPYQICNQIEIEQMPPFPFPNIGSYCPKDWELVDHFQCDKCGNGDGFSLGTKEIKARLQVGKAYAIIEEGEFQLVIGEFKYIG